MAELDGVQVPVNEYFLDHPDAVLGELRAVHGAHNAEDLVVAASGDTGAALARALTRIAADAASRGLTWTAAPEQAGPPAAPAGPRSRQPDGYLEAHRDGTFTQVADGHAVPFPVPASQGAELRAAARAPRRRHRPAGSRSRLAGRHRRAGRPAPGPQPPLRQLPAGLRPGQPVLLAAHRPHRPRHGGGEAGPHPPAAGRLPLRPVRAAGPGAGGIRPGQPDRRQGRDLHRPRRRPPQPPAGRRHPRRRAGDLPGRLRRGPAGRDRPAARHRRGAGPPGPGHPGLRRPRIRAAGTRRGIPVRPGPRQARSRRTGRRRRSPLRGQRRRTAQGHPGRPDARRDRRPARCRLDRRLLGPGLPPRDPRRRHRAGRASRRPGLDRPRQPAHRPGHLHLGHQPLPGPAARPGGPGTAPHRGPRQDRRRRLGPEHGGDPRRAGKSRRARRPVRRVGLGRPRPGRAAGRTPTTGCSTTSCCATTTTPSCPCPAWP